MLEWKLNLRCRSRKIRRAKQYCNTSSSPGLNSWCRVRRRRAGLPQYASWSTRGWKLLPEPPGFPEHIDKEGIRVRWPFKPVVDCNQDMLAPCQWYLLKAWAWAVMCPARCGNLFETLPCGSRLGLIRFLGVMFTCLRISLRYCASEMIRSRAQYDVPQWCTVLWKQCDGNPICCGSFNHVGGFTSKS